MAASNSTRNPPAFTDVKQYETWKKEVSLWQICCKLDKKEQAPALALSLTGSGRDAALELGVEELNADDGVAKLLAKLDGLFLKDENQRIYVSLKSFEKYKREFSQSIDSYINEFERFYNKVKSYGIVLPDAVIAYRLLESANLESSKAELVRTTINKLEYNEMKAQLRKLEDIAVTPVNDLVKDEPEDTFFNKTNRGKSRGKYFRSKGLMSRGAFRSRGGNFSGSCNATGRGACFNCNSKNHWANECPDKDNDHTLYTAEDESQYGDIKLVL